MTVLYHLPGGHYRPVLLAPLNPMDAVLTRAVRDSTCEGEHYYFRGGERSVDGALDEDLAQVRLGTCESANFYSHPHAGV